MKKKKSCSRFVLKLRASAGNILRLRILNSDWGLDRGVRVVSFQGEVLVEEIL